MTSDAIVYIRYSDARQEKGQSLARQEQLTGDFCKKHGFHIADRVEDLGRSAWKGHHLRDGNLGKLTRQIEAGLVAPGTVIVAEKFDRFARLPRKETQAWINKVTAAGLKIALVDPGRIYDANTSLIDEIEILLRVELAWQESQQKSERVLDAKRRAWEKAERKEGAWVMNSRVPGWMTVKPTRDGFDLIPERVQTVRDIYQWSADGIGAPSIAKRLNGRGDAPWGEWRKGRAGWDVAQIKWVLSHPAVEGDYVPGAVAPTRKHPEIIKMPGRIVGYFDRIVDAELVERARAGVKARKLVGNRGKGGIANLFAGLVHCGVCGNRAHVGWSTRSTNKYLRCDAAQRSRGCTNKAQFNYTAFETTALDLILNLAMDERFFESADEMARLRIQIAEARKRISNAEAQQREWLAAYKDRVPPATVRDRIDELEREIVGSKSAIERLQGEHHAASGAVSGAEHLKRIHNIRATLHDPDPALREQARAKVQRALASVVQTVELDPTDTLRDPAGERTLTLILKTGLLAFKIDNAGKLIGDAAGQAPTSLAEGGEIVEDIIRRRAVA